MGVIEKTVLDERICNKDESLVCPPVTKSFGKESKKNYSLKTAVGAYVGDYGEMRIFESKLDRIDMCKLCFSLKNGVKFKSMTELLSVEYTFGRTY